MSKIWDAIKNAGIQIKIALAAIAGFFALVLFFFVRRKILAKQHLEYELSKITSEKELIRLDGDSKLKKQKLEQLTEKEFEIREKIEILEKLESETHKEITLDELDEFFKSRGF